MKSRIWLFAPLLTFFVASDLSAQVALPQFFSDHMVLQRYRDSKIWGRARADTKVVIEFKEREYETTVDRNGRWEILIPAGSASSEGADMTITNVRKSTTIKDVIVGEVWLASGQSNMVFSMDRVPEYVELLKNAKLPSVRMFSAAQTPSGRPREDVAGKWHIPSEETAKELSAVAFFFAKKLHEDLDVPVGIIKTAWGGKPVETFTSREALNSLPETKKLVDLLMLQQRRYTPEAAKQLYDQRVAAHKEQMKEWEATGKAEGKRRPRNPVFPKQPLLTEGNPGVLFNGMINPFIGYSIRGAIWYQGEANAKTGKVPYDITLPLMIKDWRSRWNEEFPFLFVQLANFRPASTEPGNNDPWPLLQDRMRRILETTPKTGMATINDVGDANDIHPKDKKTPGERLARWALATTYGFSIPKSGPLYQSSSVEGNAMNIVFNDVGRGLKSRDDQPLRRFEIAGDDKVWHWADAKITNAKTVNVSSPKVPKPVAVRYAWAANPEGANLVNSEGLPTSVFRTDDWDDVITSQVAPRTKKVAPPPAEAKERKKAG